MQNRLNNLKNVLCSYALTVRTTQTSTTSVKMLTKEEEASAVITTVTSTET